MDLEHRPGWEMARQRLSADEAEGVGEGFAHAFALPRVPLGHDQEFTDAP